MSVGADGGRKATRRGEARGILVCYKTKIYILTCAPTTPTTFAVGNGL